MSAKTKMSSFVLCRPVFSRRRLSVTVNKTVLMPFPEQVDFEDYRDMDGVKLPFKIRYSASDTFNSWTRTFTEIKRNAVVEDKLFAMPAAPPQ
jgi:hypothetical protein